MTFILSPHLDDAVLSLGQFMQTERCTVITIFAGIPPEGLSDYDKSCGFSSSAEAMDARRTEDTNALWTLGARPWHLDFLDHQYGVAADARAIVAFLAARLAEDAPLYVPAYVPLGIGHPDHRAVAACVRAACPAGRSVFVHEELPYRVLQPEQVVEALDLWRDDGFVIEPVVHPIAQGDRATKAEAIACYRSQFPDGADDPCLLVPERVWRATRPEPCA